MEVVNITKAFFLHLSYKTTRLLFFVTALFNVFMRQTVIADFWGLHYITQISFLSVVFNLLGGVGGGIDSVSFLRTDVRIV